MGSAAEKRKYRSMGAGCGKQETEGRFWRHTGQWPTDREGGIVY